MPFHFMLGHLFVLQSNGCLKQANRACSSGLEQRIKEATEQVIKGKEKSSLRYENPLWFSPWASAVSQPSPLDSS